MDIRECPICGDTYVDLPEHLASGRKDCGPRLLEQMWQRRPELVPANEYSVKLKSE